MSVPDVADLLEGEPPHDQVVFETRLQRYWPDLLAGLTGAYPDHAPEMADRLVEIAAQNFRQRPTELRLLDLRRHADPQWFQHPRMLGYATYADLFGGDLRRGGRARSTTWPSSGVTYLHLMPLLKPRPGQNDGGYAVMDYRAVRDDLGTDRRPARPGHRRCARRGISLTLDLVLNHVAAEHEWAGQRPGRRPASTATTSTCSPTGRCPTRTSESLPEVFPDFAPGNFTFDEESSAWVWTTFNTWQWDLNWHNPEVFYEFADLICWLANLGVECLRLDAIAFIFKRMGTNCQNQPEVHAITQALRTVARIARPGADLQGRGDRRPDGPRPLPRRRQARRQGQRPGVPELADGADLVGAGGQGHPAVLRGDEPVPGQAADHRLGHLPALPRRHRLGDRRRGRGVGRAERLRAPPVPGRLLRRPLPDERRPRPGLPGEPGHRRPADQRHARPRWSASRRPWPAATRRTSTWPSGGCCWRTTSCSASAGCRCSTWATSWPCATTTTSSTTRSTPTTTAGCTGRRCPGTWPSAGTIRARVEHRVWHGLRHAITVRAALPSMDASVETEILDPVNPAVLVFVRRSPTQTLVGLYNITPGPAEAAALGGPARQLGLGRADRRDPADRRPLSARGRTRPAGSSSRRDG